MSPATQDNGDVKYFMGTFFAISGFLSVEAMTCGVSPPADPSQDFWIFSGYESARGKGQDEEQTLHGCLKFFADIVTVYSGCGDEVKNSFSLFLNALMRSTQKFPRFKSTQTFFFLGVTGGKV